MKLNTLVTKYTDILNFKFAYIISSSAAVHNTTLDISDESKES